ncbi:MAG: hypothetical protein Hens3KO_06370 [Henriciella sp.]
MLKTSISPLLSTKEAADLVCLSPRTLETLRVRGGGPEFVRLGRAIRYRPEALQAWIDLNSAISTSDRYG